MGVYEDMANDAGYAFGTPENALMKRPDILDYKHGPLPARMHYFDDLEKYIDYLEGVIAENKKCQSCGRAENVNTYCDYCAENYY